MDTRQPAYACGAVIWRKTDTGLELLLIKQFAHKESWGIPKGHVQPGETFEQCALREVHEEAGIDVKLGTRMPDAETAWNDERKIVISWLSEQLGDATPNTTHEECEVAEVRWFSIDNLPRIHVYQRPLIAYAKEFLQRTTTLTYLASDR